MTLCKVRGDRLKCEKYISQTLKLWDRIIEKRLRELVESIEPILTHIVYKLEKKRLRLLEHVEKRVEKHVTKVIREFKLE